MMKHCVWQIRIGWCFDFHLLSKDNVIFNLKNWKLEYFRSSSFNPLYVTFLSFCVSVCLCVKEMFILVFKMQSRIISNLQGRVSQQYLNRVSKNSLNIIKGGYLDSLKFGHIQEGWIQECPPVMLFFHFYWICISHTCLLKLVLVLLEWFRPPCFFSYFSWVPIPFLCHFLFYLLWFWYCHKFLEQLISWKLNEQNTSN